MSDPASGPLTLAAVGDCLIGRRVSELRDPDFLALVGLLRGADCSWGNCEVVLVDPRTVYRVPKLADPHAYCEPWGADELRFLGLDLMATANNHTMDFGVKGLGSTLASLDRAGIVHAGTGFDLEQAAWPAYLTTAAGQVALVDCASTFLDYYAAGPSHPVHKGRPGLNPLHLQYTVVVDPPLFERLNQAHAAIREVLGWDENADTFQRIAARRPAGTAFFFDTVIEAGEAVGFRSEPLPADVLRVLTAIRLARRNARIVIASIHTHEAHRSLEHPDPFLPPFARACIDAGADVFLAAGPHVMRGIEIYRGKPVVYSLGNFCAHFRVPAGATRKEKEAKALDGQRRFWESFVPRFTFAAEGRVTAIELHPITLGFDEPMFLQGTPRLARGEEAFAILSRLAELSHPYGTKIDLDKEMGRIVLEDVDGRSVHARHPPADAEPAQRLRGQSHGRG